MTGRPIETIGVDTAQWKALVRVYLRMDMRAAGGPIGQRAGRGGRLRRHPMFGVAMITLMGSAMFAALVAQVPDLQLSATLLATYGALNTVMMLLIDFTGLVVSPDDYTVLGHRPVSSRTYFAARLTSILVYIALLGAMLSALPALVYTFWRHLGAAGFVATFATVILGNVSIAVLVISMYVVLMGLVHPHRLRRAMSYLQLISLMSFYGAYYLTMEGFRDTFVARARFEDLPWMWINPASWFAAFIRIAGGGAGREVWIAAGAALALTIACIPLAAGRLSLDYARRLGEITAAGEPPRRTGRLRMPPLGRHEARAVGLLVAAQFRFDVKFRMAVLSILPLIVFYMLIGLKQGALRDPFTSGIAGSGTPMYMAVVFMPMTLQASLRYSDSWRAAWIFFASPASAARLIVSAKNLVAVWFLGGYLLFLALVWSYFYERVWHAFFHAAMIGLMAHMLLQVAIMLNPALPFGTEPRKAERSSGLMGVFFFGSLAAAIVSALLPLVYRRPWLTVCVLGLMLAATAALEYTLRRRVTDAIGDLEFSA